MNEETIQNLKEALMASPDNIPLRFMLAHTYLQMNRLDDAENQYVRLLQLDTGNQKGKLGLATVYFKKEQYATATVILEELLKVDPNSLEILTLYSKALLRDNAMEDALMNYQQILQMDPSFTDEELDKNLRVSNHIVNGDEEEWSDMTFIQKPDVNFSDVGGMEDVKKEIDLKIIQPLKHPELYKAYGKKTGGGILLYGPPGCGKTHIARATAGQVKAKFISVGLNDILDMWIGSSEKNLHEIFEQARNNAPCVLFFDEIDALGASRSDMKQSAGRHLINQFLQELDGLENTNDGVLILGATNTPWHLDPAFRRPGRFDRIIFVPPPDAPAREEILKLKLAGKPIDHIDYGSIGKKTKDFSGADLEAIIDISIEEKLSESFTTGIPKPLVTKDLIKASKQHKATTKEWFTTAKNFALYANDSGLYDDILTYLKIKKK